MKATVQLIARPRSDYTGPDDAIVHRVVECDVRLGMQGYGSVELEVLPLTLGAFPPPTPNLHFRFETLETVLDHPKVLGVTFHGPWNDDESHAPITAEERAIR